MSLWIRSRWYTLLLVLGIVEDFGPDGINGTTHTREWINGVARE